MSEPVRRRRRTEVNFNNAANAYPRSTAAVGFQHFIKILNVYPFIIQYIRTNDKCKKENVQKMHDLYIGL